MLVPFLERQTSVHGSLPMGCVAAFAQQGYCARRHQTRESAIGLCVRDVVNVMCLACVDLLNSRRRCDRTPPRPLVKGIPFVGFSPCGFVSRPLVP